MSCVLEDRKGSGLSWLWLDVRARFLNMCTCVFAWVHARIYIHIHIWHRHTQATIPAHWIVWMCCSLCCQLFASLNTFSVCMYACVHECVWQRLQQVEVFYCSLSWGSGRGFAYIHSWAYWSFNRTCRLLNKETKTDSMMEKNGVKPGSTKQNDQQKDSMSHCAG